jgi:uncharacterized protein (TIGR02246 family)
MIQPSDRDRREIEAIVAGLEAAWNGRDAVAYLKCFEDDADFVVITGQRLKGRGEILSAHEAIFGTIYAESRNRYAIEQIRLLTPEVVTAHLHARLQVRSGPLAGVVEARPTMTLVRRASGWRIAAFQNTEIKARPAADAVVSGAGRRTGQTVGSAVGQAPG